MSVPRWLALLVCALLLGTGSAHAGATGSVKKLPGQSKSRQAAAPRVKMMKLGLQAVACAEAAGLPKAQRLALIDYSVPANLPRLWVLDLATGETLFREQVAHGKGTGEARAVRFSNEPESYTSSLGLFRTLDTYDGSNGYSLRLEGLEPGINDRAFERRIVMHGADYVSDAFIKISGRLGRSFGCPAVRRSIARPLIDSLKHEQYLFAYYPDPAWLKSSPYLACTTASQRVPVKAAGARHASGTGAAD
ncbi:MAG: murein L,D-transpeptidase catalytic domain family protein [Panacagrimonas sp.]